MIHILTYLCIRVQCTNFIEYMLGIIYYNRDMKYWTLVMNEHEFEIYVSSERSLQGCVIQTWIIVEKWDISPPVSPASAAYKKGAFAQYLFIFFIINTHVAWKLNQQNLFQKVFIKKLWWIVLEHINGNNDSEYFYC